MEAMKQLGLALVYLHANRIVHRGIKPENIFVSLTEYLAAWQQHSLSVKSAFTI